MTVNLLRATKKTLFFQQNHGNVKKLVMACGH